MFSRPVWAQRLAPPDIPVWLALSGNASLAIVLFSATLILLPVAVTKSLPRPFQNYRSFLISCCWRAAELSCKGPFISVLFYCLRKCGRGQFSSLCQQPKGLKIEPKGSDDVFIHFLGVLPANPLHEEEYILEWRFDDNLDQWHQKRVSEEYADGKKARYNFMICNLPPNRELRFRACAVNARGRSAWTPEVGARTHAKPSDEGGFEGALGLAARPELSTYFWGQTAVQVTVRIPIPGATKSKDLKLNIYPTRLDIRCAVEGGGDNGDVLLEGGMPHKITADETYWDIQADHKNGRHIQLVMTKSVENQKWPCLLCGAGHPLIDLRHLHFRQRGLAAMDMWD